jgi:hypothetical protein
MFSTCSVRAAKEVGQGHFKIFGPLHGRELGGVKLLRSPAQQLFFGEKELTAARSQRLNHLKTKGLL